MNFGYPISWIIFSAVMLNMQFIGVYCGTGWRNVIPLHVTIHSHDTFLNWFPKSPRKPPDPVRTVKIVAEDNYNNNSFFESANILFDDPCNENKIEYSMNHIVYTVSKGAIKNSKEETLIDRGANGGLAGNNVRVTHKTGCSVDAQGIDNH